MTRDRAEPEDVEATTRMTGNGNHAPPVRPSGYDPARRRRRRTKRCADSAGVLLADFVDYTSSHGFAHIKRVENPVGRIVWTALTLVGVGVAVYQAYNVISMYRQYEYNTLMDIKFDANVTFPMVTVCNLNPYRLSQLDKLAAMDPDLMKKYKGFTKHNSTESEFDSLDDLRQAINQLSPNNRSLLGHQLEDMLIRCDYGSKECGTSNFTAMFNYAFGNCYSFNERAVHITNRAGPRYGLKLILFTEIHEYIPTLAGSTGFKVVVHDQNQVPFPEEEGFHVSSGFKTLIGARRFEMKRLGNPYYNCHPSSTAGELNLYHKIFPKSYSRSVCIRSCYQNELIAKCGCYSDEIPTPEFLSPDIRACSLNESYEQCSVDLYSKYFDDSAVDIDTICPRCHPVCTEVKYYGTYSQSMIPVPQETYVAEYLETLATKSASFRTWLESLEARNLSRDSLNEIARYALAEVQIFFDELNYEYVYQKRASTPTDVISNLGGQLGLWIGMSLLSVFEYFELLGRLVVLTGRRLRVTDIGRQSRDLESISGQMTNVL